jgi:hypothetical protein
VPLFGAGFWSFLDQQRGLDCLGRAPSHRYLVIETLPVTERGRCVTVYDIRTESFVGYAREFQ